MNDIWNFLANSYSNYAGWLWREISFQSGMPFWRNYFFWFLALALFFFGLEILSPWRKKQAILRKDFWLDFFYMIFNYFLFSLIIFAAYQDVLVKLFDDFLAFFGMTNVIAFEIQSCPAWSYYLLLFVVADFISWNVHRLLHRIPWLWEFHKVHHSVEQMGFAAHLRYHWMENIVYKTIQFLPLTLLGYNLVDIFGVHIFTLAVGHFNHSNFKINLGPLKYIFNNPQMHIWHHAYDIPKERKYGVNFGITLSVWDYLFGKNYIPHDGKDIRLGFPGVERFPRGFMFQNIHGLVKKSFTMIKPLLFLSLISMLGFGGLSSCNFGGSQSELSAEETEKYLNKGTEIARVSFVALSTKLSEAIADSGVAYAMKYCHLEAYPITDSIIQQEQAFIRRTSHKYRNPLNAPDSMESVVLHQFEEAHAGGNKPKPMIMPIGKDSMAFYAPIILPDFCLKCHGQPETDIAAGDLAVLNELYPEDKAYGFAEGDLRGMWSIRMKR